MSQPWLSKLLGTLVAIWGYGLAALSFFASVNDAPDGFAKASKYIPESASSVLTLFWLNILIGTIGVGLLWVGFRAPQPRAEVLAEKRGEDLRKVMFEALPDAFEKLGTAASVCSGFCRQNGSLVQVLLLLRTIAQSEVEQLVSLREVFRARIQIHLLETVARTTYRRYAELEWWLSEVARIQQIPHVSAQLVAHQRVKVDLEHQMAVLIGSQQVAAIHGSHRPRLAFTDRS